MAHLRGMKRTLLTLCAALFSASAAFAQSNSDMIRGTLLPGWQQSDGSHVAGLALDLAPGWKTYWRAPGDAGIPPRFDWRGSRNLAAVSIQWPTPEVMDQNGMVSIGYPHDVVLPVVIRPKSAGDIRVKARVELGVCRDICIPAEITVTGTLPSGPGKRDPRIVAALVDQPLSADEAGVGHVTCSVRPSQGGVGLRAEIAMPSAGGREFTIVETNNPQLWVAEARTMRKGRKVIAETVVSHVDGRPFALDRSGLRITVLGRDHAVDIRGCSSQ